MSIAEVEAQELALEPPQGGLWSDAFRRLRRNPGAILGAVLVSIFICAALFAPLLAHGHPKDQNLILVAGGCCPGPSHAPSLWVRPLGPAGFTPVLLRARHPPPIRGRP